MVSLFGFEIKRRTDQEDKKLPAFVAPTLPDGALTVEATGGSYGVYNDLDGSIRTEAELVTRYRNMALQPEIDMGIDEIINEVIVDEEEAAIVEIVLDDIEGLSDSIKTKIEDEFDECLRLLDFNHQAYEIFRHWYVDGRIYFHAMIDPANSGEGIQELRYIDPRKIRKIREVKKIRTNTSEFGVQTETIKVVKEYYIFNDAGFQRQGVNSNSPFGGPLGGLRIAKDSICYSSSGITDEWGKMVLGYLHKAIKPLNQLRAIEDASVIYRLSRAPERRVFYIDIGNLPRQKAEQYMRDMMVKHKNRLVYDAQTGAIRDDRKFMTLYEDYWLPRREGGKSTEIDTLPAGENLGKMDDVLYFQKRLFKSLNVPVGRLQPEDQYTLGRETGITRDEVKFARFVERLRLKFAIVFLSVLEKNLALKNIMSPEEWEELRPQIKFRFARDNYFSELKEADMMINRSNVAVGLQPYVGVYYSHNWIRRHVFQQTDDDIREQDKLIKKEATNPVLNPPVTPEGEPMGVSPHKPGPDDGQDVGPQPTPPKQMPLASDGGKPKPAKTNGAAKPNGSAARQ